MLLPVEEEEETKMEVMEEVGQTNGCWSVSGAAAVVVAAVVGVLETLSAEEEGERSRSHWPACGHAEI